MADLTVRALSPEPFLASNGEAISPGTLVVVSEVHGLCEALSVAMYVGQSRYFPYRPLIRDLDSAGIREVQASSILRADLTGVARTAQGLPITVCSTVGFRFTSEDYSQSWFSGLVVGISPDCQEVFVTCPGNLMPEGWIPARECQLEQLVCSCGNTSDGEGFVHRTPSVEQAPETGEDLPDGLPVTDPRWPGTMHCLACGRTF